MRLSLFALVTFATIALGAPIVPSGAADVLDTAASDAEKSLSDLKTACLTGKRGLGCVKMAKEEDEVPVGSTAAASLKLYTDDYNEMLGELKAVAAALQQKDLEGSADLNTQAENLIQAASRALMAEGKSLHFIPIGQWESDFPKLIAELPKMGTGILVDIGPQATKLRDYLSTQQINLGLV